MKKPLYILLTMIILVGGFFVINNYIYNEKQEDEIVTQADTEERMAVKIGEKKGALGVTIVPIEILEDSRCPVDVTCIWAGTVRVRATLGSGLGTANQVFELNQTITTEAEEVTLVDVTPVAQSGVSVGDLGYTFFFDIKKR